MNTLGQKLKVTLFGSSHGPELGIVLDGVPAGIEVQKSDFIDDLSRRAPAATGTTERHESDEVIISAGILDGYTTGAPIVLKFTNDDTRSEDYSTFRDIPRPGHADMAASVKYGGFNDLRGGGQFSGRMTLPIVAAGVIAKKIIPRYIFSAKVVELGGSDQPRKWNEMICEAMDEKDSLGAVVECEISNAPAGLGEPFFDSVESLLAHAVFSIPGVRGIEFGDGFRAAAMRGSAHNDPWTEIGPKKNGAGGINGGISNGAPIVFRVAFKPSSSIGMPQKTMNFKTGQMEELSIKGRHDCCFAVRTPVIVESLAALVLADLSL